MANTPKNPASKELVTKGQENDPAVPAPLDKNGEANNIAAPGEALAGEERGHFKATGAFLVYDPYTMDCVGEAGGEMRVTQFVRDQLENGKLAEA